MATEEFDIVNLHDKTTGQVTTKVEAHTDGIWHRLVAVYVFDTDGKLLVQDHKKHRLLDHSVGGHVRAGETYPQAAAREASEELGLDGLPLTELFTGLYSYEIFDAEKQGDKQLHFFGIYECHLPAGWKFEPNDEVDKILHMDLKEVVDLLNAEPGRFTPGIVNTMEKYIEVKKLPYDFDVERLRAKWGASYAKLSAK